MKKLQILSLGLAMSLMVSQTAQAAVYITPFGTTEVYEEQVVAGENTTIAPESSTEDIVPGYMQDVTVAESQTGGPGATEQTVSQVMKPSATYSTTEPVQVTTANQAAGPGANQSSATTSTAGGPGAVTESSQTSTTQTTAQAMTAEELSKAAVAAGITVPEVSAEGAILYDVTHDTFVFEKNADKQFYPASITKILTALLVLENAKLDETVTFSQNAVTRLESGAVTLQMQEGDQVSVKDCLYGLLLKSANEVANGLAEHVGGTLYGFADMMNAKAAALGCTNSHFVNPNGLNDSDHYTTARDMAKIAKAAFANETLCKIASTTSYKFPATKAAAERTITMGHKMLYTSDSRYYDGIVGGKTGYTSLAGNTLVTCVERDGVRMIAVILQSRSTHYTDTKAMLDYGYALSKAGILTQNTSSASAPVQGVSGGPGVGSSAASQESPTAPGTTASQTTTAYHKWTLDGSTWYFDLADGTRLSNCFVLIDGKEYAFDTEGKMVTGWLTLGTNWHYFGSSGAMIKGAWRQDDGLWFYLGDDGAMVRNAWIDNQYYVGEDGVWVE